MKRKSILLGLLALTLTAFTACSILIEDSSSLQSVESASQQESVTVSGGIEESIDGGDSSCWGSSVAETPLDSESGERERVYYTVQFDTDGGSDVASVSVLEGEKLLQPQTPTKITKTCEYIFLGWFYEGEAWDFDKGVVTQDMTLVAHWKEGEKYTEPFLPKD